MVTSISDYKLDFGAQYTQALNKKSSLTIGAVYSPKHKLNNDYTSIVIMGASSSSYGTEYKDVLDATFELPNTFGVGFTYNYDKRLTVGADYSLQQWSKTNFGVVTSDENVRQDFNETFTYCDRTKISVGAEYIPNLMGRSYYPILNTVWELIIRLRIIRSAAKRLPVKWRNCRFRSACASFPFHS